jgi:hypothetical protein
VSPFPLAWVSSLADEAMQLQNARIFCHSLKLQQYKAGRLAQKIIEYLQFLPEFDRTMNFNGQDSGSLYQM